MISRVLETMSNQINFKFNLYVRVTHTVHFKEEGTTSNKRKHKNLKNSRKFGNHCSIKWTHILKKKVLGIVCFVGVCNRIGFLEPLGRGEGCCVSAAFWIM